jgi:hypothetical protein
MLRAAMGRIANTFLIVGTILAGVQTFASSVQFEVSSDAVIFYINHDDVPVGHKVTDADVTEWFLANKHKAGITNEKLSPDGGAIDIVADPSGDPARGNVMRVFQSEGGYGFRDGLNGPSGGQWRSWPGEYEELYFAYDFYMTPERLWSKGQKLPGLMGGDWAAGSGGSEGGSPDGTNGFSARLMMFSTRAYPYRGDGALAQYTYYTEKAQKPLWYDDGPSGQINLEHGKWYTIETYIKLNTPGKENGKMHAWVDGEMVLNRNNIKWRTVDSLKLDGVFFAFGYGGGSSSWAAPEDQYNYFDNWILSTQPISHY